MPVLAYVFTFKSSLRLQTVNSNFGLWFIYRFPPPFKRIRKTPIFGKEGGIHVTSRLSSSYLAGANLVFIVRTTFSKMETCPSNIFKSKNIRSCFKDTNHKINIMTC